MTTAGRRILQRAALALLVLCAVSAPSASADVVELTTGQKIIGVIKRITPQGLVIDVQGQERTVAQGLVRGLAFEPVRPASPPPTSPPAPAPVAPRVPSPSAEPAPPSSGSTAARSEQAATPPAASEPEPPKSEPAPAAAPGARPGGAAEPPAAAPSTAPQSTDAGATPAEPTAPAPPPRPTIVVAKLSPRTLRDAMQALFDLRAASVPSASPQEYAARVAQARPRVDRYLRDDGDSRADVKNTLRAAMRLYSFAASAWSVYAEKGDFASLGRDPTLAECPQLQQAIARDAADWKFKADDPAFAGLIAGSEGLPELWACASDRLAAAERLLGGSTQ